MEAAWLSLEDAVAAESSRWEAAAREISVWKKPMWPVVLLGTLGTAGAVWLGLVFGGYVASPEWFSAVWVRMVGP